MTKRAKWMIYGANGYAGHLVAAEARRRGLHPVLAGRHAGAVEKLAAEFNLTARIFDLDDARATASALADLEVVANCAGPFAATSAQMIDGCLTSRTHYLDISAEIDVFLAAQRRDADANGPAQLATTFMSASADAAARASSRSKTRAVKLSSAANFSTAPARRPARTGCRPRRLASAATRCPA